MRVVALSNSLSRRGGGLFWSVRGLASGLKCAGCEVFVLAPEDADTEHDLSAWGATAVRALPVCGPASFGFTPDLLGTMENFKPDILHVNGMWKYEAVAAFRWKRRSGSPYIVSPHGMLDGWALRNSAWKKRITSFLYQRRFISNADCIHALNLSEVQSIRALNLNNPVAVIPNGVDLPKAASGMPAPDWVSAVPEGSKVLLFLGRLHPKKGLIPLLNAWARVRKGSVPSGEDWHLVVAGWEEGGHQSMLEALAEDLRVSGSVLFVGPQFEGEKAASLSRADAFVLPSFSEGLPMAILEAWAHKLPVMMTPQCNLPEGFETGAALAIEPAVSSIEEGLKVLFSMKPSDLAEMGIRGCQLVESRFTWTRIASEMHAVYQWLLGQADKPDCVIEAGDA